MGPESDCRPFSSHLNALQHGLPRVALILPLMGALCLTLVPWQTGAALAAPAQPATDWSFYVLSGNTNDAYNLGYKQGQFDAGHSPVINSFVVLDFGVQTSDGSGVVTTFTQEPLANSNVKSVAEDFAQGYWDGTGSDTTSVMTLGVGTNDSINYSSSTYTTLGTSWANLVSAITSDEGIHRSQIVIWGANDIESWASPSGFYVPSADANAWVNAYSKVDPAAYDNYGSADGCPWSYTGGNGEPCGSGYNQYDYYYYSWGAPPAFSTPEIYFAGNAEQWTYISLYAKYYQIGMSFEGPWDENDLDPSTLTSSQAWIDLSNDLSGAGVASGMTYSAEIHCEYQSQC